MIGHMNTFKLEYLPRDRVSETLHMSLPPEQVPFAGHIADLVTDDNPLRDFHVARLDGTVVGFFKVETAGYANEMPLAPDHALGIRMVMVDQAQQGKGIAKAMFAALPDHLRASYPDATEAYLTVNCKNPRARHVYLTGGWVDTGDLYLDGGYGPQHVMRLSLR